MKRFITSTLLAVGATLMLSAGMATVASAAPSKSHGFGFTSTSRSAIQHVDYRRHRHLVRCSTERQVSWWHGRRIVRLVRVCR